MKYESEMKCEYALMDQYDPFSGSFITLCDCPGGCEYRKSSDYDDRNGIIYECTKILNYNGKEYK